MQVLNNTKSERKATPPRWVAWVAAAVCVGAITLLFYALVK